MPKKSPSIVDSPCPLVELLGRSTVRSCNRLYLPIAFPTQLTKTTSRVILYYKDRIMDILDESRKKLWPTWHGLNPLEPYKQLGT